MESILNILVLGFAGLIAYWWATQGLFSSVLHFICVLAAGVLAFATWEPMTDLVASISSLQPYGRGIGLVLPFAVYLFALRMLSDKLAPDNLNFPHWANLSLGGAFGVASAILTVGITLIGVGHLHSSRDLVGVVGSARTSASKGQPDLQVSALWIPVHVEAARFFGMLSQSSFAPTFSTTTLASEHPNLGQQAFGLHRDTYNRAGRLSRTTAAKNSISIVKAILKREDLGTTGIGRGVAVPHTKHPSVDKLVGTVAVSQEGIDFDSLDGDPVHLFFLLVSPPDQPGQHLRALENISRQLRDDAFCRELKAAKAPADIQHLLEAADNHGMVS